MAQSPAPPVGWLMTRPLNIGHRGASALAPENTLAGLLAGVQAGADGVEFDVQRTKDGHLVLFHDDNLARITGVRGLVVKNTLAQLAGIERRRLFRSPVRR